jgi:hypothetical protein
MLHKIARILNEVIRAITGFCSSSGHLDLDAIVWAIGNGSNWDRHPGRT